MLLPAEVDFVLKKSGCKRNLVLPGYSYDGKVVFILLAKIVTFYVGPTIVDVRSHGFEFVSQRSVF